MTSSRLPRLALASLAGAAEPAGVVMWGCGCGPGSALEASSEAVQAVGCAPPPVLEPAAVCALAAARPLVPPGERPPAA
jgi:hypothetical protein